MRFPSSIFVSVSLFTAETTAALYLSSTYRSAGDQIWQGLTLLFTLLASVLVQLTLTFIHRDLNRDRPLVLFLHLLQLGPIVRLVGYSAIYSTHVYYVFVHKNHWCCNRLPLTDCLRLRGNSRYNWKQMMSRDIPLVFACYALRNRCYR